MKSVCIIGAGPAGIAAAEVLGARKFDVTMFEKKDKPGGCINLIPDSRFNKKHIEIWMGRLESYGVKIHYNINVDLEDIKVLKDKYDYVLIATGTQKVRQLEGVDGLYAIDFLEKMKTIENKKEFTGYNIAVIGGGNVAIDCACEAAERGANTMVFYRKTKEDMKATDKEFQHAESLGVKFAYNFEAYEFIKADAIIIAIGTEPLLPENIEDKRTFVIGDASTGSSSMANAMNHAKAIAGNIR